MAFMFINTADNSANSFTDVVFIEGLTVKAVIGIYEWERVITQPLVIDVAMMTDIHPAANSDDVRDAINYQSVCEDIEKWCVTTKAQLVERLAELIADNILTNYACEQVMVKITKPSAISNADGVGVQIVRQKKTDKS